MKLPRFATAALLASTIVACSKPVPTETIAIDNDAASPAAGEPPHGFDAPNSVTAAAENAATEAGRGNVAANLSKHIPDDFQGRWGLTKADCTSTKGDAKGLLTISDARLTFFESKGTPDKVLSATATSFDARYDFSGEGQTWLRTERLRLVDGKLQRRTDAEPGQEPPVNLTYSRCDG